MGKITHTTPKALVSVRGCPAIEHVLVGLREYGFHDVIVVIGHLGDQIRTRLGTGERLGARITYVNQEHAEGTARALALARSAVGRSDLLLTFSDILTDPVNYGGMRNAFYAGACDALGAIRRVDDPCRGAAVYLDQANSITRIVEKPPLGTSTTPWNHSGMYCFAPVVFDYVERVGPSARGEYEVTDAVSLMITDGRPVKAHELSGYWIDLASPAEIPVAERMLEQKDLKDERS